MPLPLSLSVLHHQFYGLQLASNNVASLHTKPFAPDLVRFIESSPEDLDLVEGAALETDDL